MSRFYGFCAALLVTAGCIDSNAPQSPPIRLRAVSPTQTVGVVGEAVPAGPVVMVQDVTGRPVPNTRVTFGLSGALLGSLETTEATSGPDGIARAGAWVLSTRAGLNWLIAQLPGDARVVAFSANGRPGAPAAIAWQMGEGLVAFPGVSVRVGRVQVVDRFANPVPEIPIAFSTSAGSGVVESPESMTREEGAYVPLWTLGTALGTQTLIARVSDELTSALTIRVEEPQALYDLVAIDGLPPVSEVAFIGFSADGYFVLGGETPVPYDEGAWVWSRFGRYSATGENVTLVYREGDVTTARQRANQLDLTMLADPEMGIYAVWTFARRAPCCLSIK